MNSPQKRRLKGHLLAVYHYLLNGYRKDRARLFSEVRRRHNRQNLQQGKIQQHIGEKKITMEVVKS